MSRPKVGDLIALGSGGYSLVSNVEDFEVADVGDKFVELTWQDPTDVVVDGTTITSWAGTQIRRKTGNYPVDEKDGVLVVDSKTRDQYKTIPYVDSGLTNGVEYFYMAFPYTDKNVFTVDSANRVSAIPSEIDPDSWKGIQRIVRKGLASDFFTIGDQLVSGYDGGEIVWEVIGIDVETPADSQYQHSMTLQTRDCLHDIQFDAPEPSNPNSDRKSYGNNRYVHSAVKQWLNSNESAFNWQAQHQYDATPTDSLELYNGAGFLHRLDPELAAVLGSASKKVALNTAADGGGQETFSDKVFLLSRVEVGLGAEGETTGEAVYPFYDGVADAKRIKELDGSPRYWWLRSPSVGSSRDVRCVKPDGSLSGSIAHNAYGVAPACVII